MEHESRSPEGLYQFLDDLGDLDSLRMEDVSLQALSNSSKLSAKDSDHCVRCQKSIEDECARHESLRWHVNCLGCSRCGKELGRCLEDARWNAFDKKTYCSNCVAINTEDDVPFEHITKLQQYVFLLSVALARLLDMLRNSGIIQPSMDDQGMNGDRTGAEQFSASPEQMGGFPQQQADPTRSKTYPGTGAGAAERGSNRESTYENTLNDVRRLRSTRLDKHISSSFRKARTSMIMDGPEGRSARPGSPGGEGKRRPDHDLHIVEDRGAMDAGTTDTMFGHNDALTLDDIPRIVAAEQVREKNHQNSLFRSPTAATTGGRGQRPSSMGRDDMQAYADQLPQRGGRRFFSELSGLEYFIVRHLAVLTMQPMLGDEFPLEELLNFIEPRKPATFWKNISKAFKNEKKPIKKKGVFGVPLEIIIERDGADSTDGVGPGTLRIPAVLDDVVSSMRQMDLSVEGVFRKNGNIKKLGNLAEAIDRDGSDAVNFMDQPVVQVAALLKRYLRELPDPLMTYKLYRVWIAAAKIPDEDKRRQCLHLACCLLPKCHRDSLEILFCFLKWASSFHQVDDESGSKMDIKNLATVIAPNILFANDKAPALDSDHMYAISAVEMLVNYLEEMCLVRTPRCFTMAVSLLLLVKPTTNAISRCRTTSALCSMTPLSSPATLRKTSSSASTNSRAGPCPPRVTSRRCTTGRTCRPGPRRGGSTRTRRSGSRSAACGPSRSRRRCTAAPAQWRPPPAPCTLSTSWTAPTASSRRSSSSRRTCRCRGGSGGTLGRTGEGARAAWPWGITEVGRGACEGSSTLGGMLLKPTHIFFFSFLTSF